MFWKIKEKKQPYFRVWCIPVAAMNTCALSILGVHVVKPQSETNTCTVLCGIILRGYYTSSVASEGGGAGGQSAAPKQKICQTEGKRGKNREREEKSGREGKNREGSFTLPLQTERAGYATVLSHELRISMFYILYLKIINTFFEK